MIEFAVGIIVGALLGVAIYRNNVDVFSPFADKLDEKVDEIKDKIDESKTSTKKTTRKK